MTGGSEPGSGRPGGRGSGGLAATARSAAQWVRRLPDRMLHPLRRRRARHRLREVSPAGPVLFVCHGNICRSPYVEAVFRQRAGSRMDAASAGLAGPDRPSPGTACEVARERGIDLEEHHSRLITGAMLREAGLVVVMDPGQALALRRRHGFGGAIVLGDLDPRPIRRRPIRDPIFQAPAFFREVYDRIDRCVGGMVDAMGLLVAGADAAAGGGRGTTAATGNRRAMQEGETA